ncbi:MAG: hypothetical protein HGA19_01900 [Oscillochloris sp.]|nr:hypothetical protein [Oscillochloris sp.]
MYFPLINKLVLPCIFTQFVPGKLHPDGRRYLPLVVLQPTVPPTSEAVSPAGLLLGIVDRHHRVAPSAIGQAGVARLVFALSTLRVQQPPYRTGFLPEDAWVPGQPSTAPTLYGQVAEVATWEEGSGQLPYQTLYTELLIDTSMGLVGLRTTITANTLSSTLGAAQVAPGDWVEIQRSRIDILAFKPDSPHPAADAAPALPDVGE